MAWAVRDAGSSDHSLSLDDASHAVEKSISSNCRNPLLLNLVAGSVLGFPDVYLKIDLAALYILAESELGVVEAFDENTSWFGTESLAFSYRPGF